MQFSDLLLTFAACLIVSTLDTVTCDIKCNDGTKTKPEDGDETGELATKEGCKSCGISVGTLASSPKTVRKVYWCLDAPCDDGFTVEKNLKALYKAAGQDFSFTTLECCDDKDLCNGGNRMSTAVSGSLLVALAVLAIVVQAFISTY
jgi:hypothetical protein